MTLTELLQLFDREHPRSGFTIRRRPDAVGVWVASAYIWEIQDTDPATAVRNLYRMIASRTIRTLPDLHESCIWSRFGGVYRPVSRQKRRYAEAIGRPISEAVPPSFSIVWNDDRFEECLYAPQPDEVTP